jgi:hypothetical protein
MSKEEASGHQTAPSDVTVISITETRLSPVPGPLRDRLAEISARHWVGAALAVALALAAVGAMILTMPGGSGTRRAAGAPGAVPGAEKATIAAALGYRYPPRCLMFTIANDDPDYARVAVARTNGCGRYHGYLDASMHRVDRIWQLVLDEGQLRVPNSMLRSTRAIP